MSTKISDKLYEKFTAKERIDLALAAITNSDDPEFKKLYQTCPLYSYTMADHEFSRGMKQLALISASFSEARYYSYVHILSFESYINGLTMIITDPEADENSLKEMASQLAQLKHMSHKHKSIIKSLYAAIHAFCNETHINPNHIILPSSINFMERAIQEYLMADEVKEDEHFFQLFKELFLSTWNTDRSLAQ